MTLKSVTLNEFCDQKKAKWLLENIDRVPIRESNDPTYDPKANITRYCKQVLQTQCGFIKQIYKNFEGKGRYYLKNNQIGFQSIMREYRSVLCSDDYYDIDMKNCQPTILEQYCIKNSIKCDELTKYNKNRDKLFKKFELLNISKEIVKKEFITMMYGGAKSVLLSKVADVDGFYASMQNILVEVTKINEYWRNIATDKDKNNIIGSTTSYICQEIENDILMLSMKFLKKRHFDIGALCFDGLMIRKTHDLTPSIIRDLNKFIEAESHYKIEFVIKQFEFVVKINPDELNYVNDVYHVDNDAEAADIVISLLDKKIIKSNNRYFIKKYEHANIFIEDISQGFIETNNIMIKMISNINIMINGVDGSPRQYSKLSKGCANILKMFLARMPTDDNFIDKTWNSNLYKIFFLNGYYDFKSSTFKNYDNESYTTVYINKHYINNANEDDMKKIYELILDPIFSNKEQQNYILNWFARGLAGHVEEKTWAFGLGNRNSGKGVITQLFEKSFNSYVSSFIAGEMISSRIGNGDIAKKLGWTIPFQFTRLIFSNELTTEDDNQKLKLDGNIIKSIASGGDEKTARLNYKDQIKFKIQCRMCIFANAMIEVTPQDACETLNVFEFPNIFKNELTDDDHKINNVDSIYKIKKGNDNIKQLILDENLQMAFIHIMIKNYTQRPITKPLSLKENLETYNDDAGGDDKIMNDLFEFTLNKLDKITLTMYNEIIKKNKLNKSKAQLILNKKGVIDARCESTRLKVGIKIKDLDA